MIKRRRRDLWEVAIVYTLLFLLIALSSCNTHKVVTTDVNQGSELIIDKEVIKDSVVRHNDFVLDFDTASFIRTWDITIYDTSVTDSATNTHPIKAIIRGTTQATNAHKTITQSEDVEEVIVQDTTHIEKRDSVQIHEKIEQTKKVSKFANFNGFLLVMGSLIVFVIALKLLFKKLL